MQFSTPELFIDHRERVHFNNRDVRPSQPKKQTKAKEGVGGKQEKGRVEAEASDEEEEEQKEVGRRRKEEVVEERKEDVAEVEASDGPESPPVSPRTIRKREVQRSYYHRKKLAKLAAAAGATLAHMATSAHTNGNGHSRRAGVSSASEHSSDDDSHGSADSSSSSSSSSGCSSSGGSDSSSGGSDDVRDADPFDRFGRADHSQSDSTSSDTDASSSSTSSSSSRPSTPPLPAFPARRPPRRRPPVQTRLHPPPKPTPRTPRPPTSPSSRTPADIRARSIRANGYLFKFRFPPSTPHHLLRCLLCQDGISAERGLLLRCHGLCGLAMHIGCMGMAWVPAGPWYCSETCDKGTGLVGGRMDELENIKVMRRWRQWLDRNNRRRAKHAHNASDGAEAQQGNEDDGLGVTPGGKGARFFIRTSATFPSSSLRPPEQSRFASEFPQRPPSTAAQVRRVFRPVSLTAPDPNSTHLTSSAQPPSTSTSAPSITPTDQLPPSMFSTSSTRPTEPKARPRSRHLMFSLKQPRLDPTELIVTSSHPTRYSHAAKGPLPITSSRSLRGASTATTLSLRSAAFLLSLRVPERDPGRANCCICEDGESVEDNPIILCDGECRMAYHQRCLGLAAMPREDEEWLCSELCKKAKARGVTLEDDVVVRLVQKRRDEYDERGPYDDKGGEGSAQLQDLFAQLDGQYFCPRTMWRLWKRGKWRLQQTHSSSLIDVMQLIGGISEPGWDVERIDSAQAQMEQQPHPQPPQQPLASEPSAALPSSAAPKADSEQRAADVQIKQVEAAAVATSEAQSVIVLPLSVPSADVQTTVGKAEAVEMADSPKPCLRSRSQSWPFALHHPSAVTPSTPHPSHLVYASNPSIQPLIIVTSSTSQPLPSPSTNPLLRSTSTTLTTTQSNSNDDDSPLLSEESRLLAAYATQVLANNQTKSRLLAALHAHPIINPSALPTLSERQRKEEDVIRTYLEYEEKNGVGTEKDRTRRAERCHVNFCACVHCYNAHLWGAEGGEDGGEEEDRDLDLTQEDGDGAGGGEEGGHADVEDGGGDDDVRIEEPTLPSSSISIFSLPRAPPPLIGSIDPEGVLRYVLASMRRRERALAMAKSVGGPELSQLLEAGKTGRTVTRGQMKKADVTSPPPAPVQPHHTRRRTAAAAAQHQADELSASPTDGSRRNQEIKSLSPWGWDRGWVLRQGEEVSAEASAEVKVVAVPRGCKRVRVVRGGEDVLARPLVVRLRKGRATRRATRRASSGLVGAKGRMEQVEMATRVEDGRERDRKASTRRKQRVKLLFEGDEMNVLSVDGQAVRRLRTSRNIDVPLAMASSASAATSAVAALAAGLVQQLQSGTNKMKIEERLQYEEEAELASGAVSVSAATVDSRPFPPLADAASDAADVQPLEPPRAGHRSISKKNSHRRPTEEQRQVHAAKKLQKARLERERKYVEQMAWVQQHERMVELHLLVDGDGKVQLQLRVLVDYPWGRKKKFDELTRLRNPYLTDAPLVTSSIPLLSAPLPIAADEAAPLQMTDVAAAVVGEGDDTSDGRRRRSIRPRRSTTAALESQQSILISAPQQPPQPLQVEVAPTTSLLALSTKSGAPLALIAEYPLDSNGLPIVTSPIPDDICTKCGEVGELILCDSVIDGVQCHRCWHLDCLDLSRPPSGQWSCPSHSCGSCEKKGRRTRDKHAVHQPFTYCEWCDRSWCRTCAEEVQGRKEVVDWTPKRPSDAARWVVCMACIHHFRDDYGKDFRDEHTQKLAHEERLVEQLKLQAQARGEHAGHDAQPQDEGEAGQPARRSKAKRAAKRKRAIPARRSQEAEQRVAAAAEQGDETDEDVPIRRLDGGDRDDLPAAAAPSEALTSTAGSQRKRQRGHSALWHSPQARVKVEGEELSMPNHHSATNGYAHPSSSTSGGTEAWREEQSPSPHILLPCITRSDLETVAVVRKAATSQSPSADTFRFPENDHSRGWTVQSDGSSRSGRLSFKRKAVDTTTSSPPSSNGVSPISLPSPSSPASLQCLSTSSTLSMGSASSSTSPPPPSASPPPPPSSLSMLAPPSELQVVLRRGEKRTRAASRVEIEGDSLLAKQLQEQINLETRTAYIKRRKSKASR